MADYAPAHNAPNGPGDDRPTAKQIIHDQGLEDKWTGKTILITGCSSGLGIQTARALSMTGATLYLTARDIPKAKEAISDLLALGRVHLLPLDLSSFESVRRCASEFLALSKSLNILIANAGVMATPEGRTKDNLETQFGTNHMAHLLLFLLLKPALLAASTTDFNSRVILLSSVGHRGSEVVFNNINLDGEYEPWKAYGQSKTAVLWTANYIDRKYSSQGLHAFSLHPGSIVTELGRHIPAEDMQAYAADKHFAKLLKSPEQGAATTVWAATAKELEGTGGKYLEDCQFAKPYQQSAGQWGPGYAPWAYDEEKERRLWSLSLKMLDITDD